MHQEIPQIYKDIAKLKGGLYKVQRKFLFFYYTVGYISISYEDGYIVFMTTSNKDYHYALADFECFCIYLHKDTLKEYIFGKKYITLNFYNLLDGPSYQDSFNTLNKMLYNVKYV